MPTAISERSTIPIGRPALKNSVFQKGTAPLTARMPRQLVASSDYEMVRKIESEYTNAWEAQREDKESLFEAWRYYFGARNEQWDKESRKYKEERDQRIAQYNIIKGKVKIYAGMLIADEYDFKYNPIGGKRNSGIEALENAYYCDKELCHYDDNYSLVIEDGAIHLGILEVGVTREFDPRGNIFFKRATPGRWVVDPYWKTDDDRNCMRAWKQGHMTVQQLMKKFKNLPSSPRFDAELTRLKQLGMDWTQPEIDEYNYPNPQFRNAFHVIEYHWVEEISKKRILARNVFGEWVPFPATNDVEKLELFAVENGVVDWKEGNATVQNYNDKIHHSAIICKELWPDKMIEHGKPEIQVKGLPIIQFTLKRDPSGRNMGMVQDLIDVQKDINYSRSKIWEILANSLGGGTKYNKNMLPDESDQEDFEKNHNDPTRAWGVNGDPNAFSSTIRDHQVNPELIRESSQMFDYGDRISGVSAAMQSQTQGASEPASLFAMKLKVNKIGTLTVDKRVKRVRERMAECYFWQAQVTYAGVERHFTSKDGKYDAILNEDLGNGYVKNDVTELPRSSVSISESENNLTKQLRDRADIAAVLESMPQEYRETIAIAVTELFRTTSLSEEKKQKIEMSLMLEQIKAKLASIAEIKNADASGKQAELMSAQAEMQLKQVMNMINLAQAPQTQQGQEPVPEMITQQQQEINVPDVSQQDQPSPNMSEPIFTE